MTGENELPEGWAWSELKQITQEIYRYPTFYGMEHLKNGIPVIRGEHILENGTISHNWDDYWHINPSLSNQYPRTILKINDIVMSVRGTIGKIGIIDNELKNAQISPNCIRISPLINIIDPKYLFYYLRSDDSHEKLLDYSTSTTISTIKASLLSRLLIPLPPLAEQRRIVAAVEALLARVNASRERLDRVPGLLKAFRQAVLAAACSGRLTEGWREELGNLARVKSHEDGIPSDLTDYQQKIIQSIPDSWDLIHVGNLFIDARYGTSKRCDYDSVGRIPIIRIPNIQTGKIDFKDLKYCDLAEKEIEKISLVNGDILICRTNGSLDLVGKAAVVSEIPGTFGYASYIIRVRLRQEAILPKYYHILLSGKYGRESIEKKAQSTAGQFNLNLEILRNFFIPLPPLPEQHEIVSRVEALFALANQIEQRVAIGKESAARLTQGILAKAFRGELVPTEAELARREGREYEPASVLLERIRQERGAEGAGVPQKRKKQLAKGTK